MFGSMRMLTAVAVLLGFYTGEAEAWRYLEFDVPGADTFPMAVNDLNEIAGKYWTGNWHGFLRKPDGTLVTFDVPGAVATQVSAINNKGEIVGTYAPEGDHSRGYVRWADGTIDTFDPPDSDFSEPYDINDESKTVGYFVQQNGDERGFFRFRKGKISIFDYDSLSTVGTAINGTGVVTGSYYPGDALVGFIRAADGTLTSFSVPDAPYTQPNDINLQGAVTGTYVLQSDGPNHGFYRRPNGHLSAFDPTGSTDTHALSVNNKDQITGYYVDGSGFTGDFFVQPMALSYKWMSVKRVQRPGREHCR